MTTTIEFEPGTRDEEPMNETPPPPPTTATGAPRTPSTPGRRPGQKNGTGKSATRTPAAPRAAASRPPAPKAGAKKDHREAVRKSIQKAGSSLLLTAKARRNPALAADAIALLEQKDAWAECLNTLAQDSKWLAVALDKAAVIAPGVEVASLTVALVAQIGVNHGQIPLEMAQLLDAKDPRELLGLHGMKIEDVPVEPVA